MFELMSIDRICRPEIVADNIKDLLPTTHIPALLPINMSEEGSAPNVKFSAITATITHLPTEMITQKQHIKIPDRFLLSPFNSLHTMELPMTPYIPMFI